MRMHFSSKAEELKKVFMPYHNGNGGLIDSAPEKAKKAFEDFKKIIDEEMWL